MRFLGLLARTAVLCLVKGLAWEVGERIAAAAFRPPPKPKRRARK